jgi:hypothetical protein
MSIAELVKTRLVNAGAFDAVPTLLTLNPMPALTPVE